MFDYSKCRLCACEKPVIDLIDIKTSTEPQSSLIHKIYYCFQIQITENDQLPTGICDICCQKLDICFEFVDQVHKAQTFLKSLNTDSDHFDDDLKLEYYSDHNSNEKKSESVVQLLPECALLEVKEEINDQPVRLRKRRKTGTQVKNQTMRRSRKKENKKFDNIDSKWNEDTSDELFYDSTSCKWKCHECSRQFETVQELRQHFSEIHNKPVVYECLDCTKVFHKYDTFQKHRRNHRNQHKFCCELCGKFSYKREHYLRHKESHSTERKYMCSTCGNYFKTPMSLRVHERLHLAVELREHECEICHKKLASQSSLWAHKKLHKEVKEHSCYICGKSFAQRPNLNQHVLLHNEGLPFECSLCPRKFKTSRRLTKHQIVHTNNKPHKCATCGKEFRAKQTLNKHKSIHLDYFPFECEYCKKGFKLKQLLKVHLRQHTGERPYECSDCSHSFTNWSNYNKHMKSRHGINMKSPVTQLIQDQQQQMQ